MKTRRSKGNESIQEDVATLEVDLPPEMDVDQLERLLPDVQVKQPNQHNILAVYNTLLEQSGTISTLNLELEELRSESIRKEVELDQTLQDQDVRFKDLEQSLNSKVAEIDGLREQIKQLCLSTFPFSVTILHAL